MGTPNTTPALTLRSDYVVVFPDDVSIKLSPKVYQLLSLLHAAGEKGTTRHSLFHTLWPETNVCSKTLDVHMSKLRRMIGAHGLQIELFQPSTYRLVQKDDTARAAANDDQAA